MSAPIFVSTSCLRRNTKDLESLLSEYMEAGLNHIELGIAAPASSLNLALYLEACQANFLIHNYFPQPRRPFVLNLAAQDRQLLALSISFCERAIDLSSKLGASFYSVHAGFRTYFTPESLGKKIHYEHIFPYQRSYDTFVQSIRHLSLFARRRGLALLIEPNVLARLNLVQGQNELALICEAWEVLKLFKDVNEPALGILLDTGHLNVTSRTLNFERLTFIEQVAPYIRAFHLHDNDGSADTHQPIQPDSWVLDLLRRPEFTTLPLIVEAKFDRVEALRQHLDWLKEELGRE